MPYRGAFTNSSFGGLVLFSKVGWELQQQKAAAAYGCSRLSGNTKLEWAADYAVVLAAVVFFVLVGFVLVVFLVVVVEASSAKTTTVVPRNAKPSIRVINLFILCGSPLEGWTISSSWVYHPSPT